MPIGARPLLFGMLDVAGGLSDGFLGGVVQVAEGELIGVPNGPIAERQTLRAAADTMLDDNLRPLVCIARHDLREGASRW
jgi:hypothetical protein